MTKRVYRTAQGKIVDLGALQLQNENGEESGYEIEFNFENESLKHKLNNTMRKNMFEVSFHLLYDISNGLIEC